MKELTVQELKTKIDSQEDFQLIDVREPFEYEICNLHGELIPMGVILNETEKIAKDKTVIIHCKSGGRSGITFSGRELFDFNPDWANDDEDDEGAVEYEEFAQRVDSDMEEEDAIATMKDSLESLPQLLRSE